MVDREQLHELAQLLETSSGVVLRDRDFGALGSFVAKRVAALSRVSDIRQYTGLLRRSPESDEWRRILSEITIKESYLFRGHAQFEGLLNVVLPELVERRRDRCLRIWCAGCARGEEAATLAVVLTESEVVTNSNWTILATDVDDAALTEARRGLFGRRAVSKVPADYLAAFFQPRGNLFELDRRLLKKIRYRRLNLVDSSAVIDAGPFDVVFMRNVLIYFRPKLQKSVVDSVALALAADGCLFTGPSESLIHLDSELRARDLGGSFCYRRSDVSRLVSGEGPSGNERISVSERAEMVGSTPAGNVPEDGGKSPVFSVRLESAIAELQDETYREVLETISGLKRDFPERPVVHALEGIAQEGAGDGEKAVLAYRAALYLAPEVGALRFLLARALFGLGRHQRARNEYRSALRSLQHTTREISGVFARVGLPPLHEMKIVCREMVEEIPDSTL